MQKRFKKVVALIAIALLVATGLTALMAAEPEAKSEAAVASQFDPGLIISDSVFYDFGTMTVSEIQRFLNAKASTRCVENVLGPKCLKDFRMDTQAVTGESGRCASMPARADQTAAQIIYYVARACGINPRVLIVTLQKEQGLIQAWNPSQRMYDFALGMSCPDTPSGCSKADAGFFWQLYKGAGQLQWYGDPRGSFTYLRVGTDIKRDYQANMSSCGYRTFRLKSQATAALYYYTPYTPNQSALDNLYGEGNNCSAYGNRNFWRFYTDWFGSTVGGGFLLKSETSGTYLIVENKKYLITDEEAVTAYASLGPVGTVSEPYLNSFIDSGNMSRLVRGSTTYYFIDGSKRYAFTNVAQVAEFGYDSTKAVRLTSSQFSALPSGGTMTEYVAGADGSKFLIEDGKKRQILDQASIASTPLPALSKVKISAFGELPWGDPIIRAGSTFVTNSTGRTMLYDGTKVYEVSPEVKADFTISNWFTTSTGKMNEAAIAPVLSDQKLKPIFANEAGDQFILTANGKRPVAVGSKLLTSVPVMSQAVIDDIPTASTTPIAATTFAKATNSTNTFLIDHGKKRLLVTAADRARFEGLVPSIRVESLNPSVMAMFAEAGPLYTPGTFVKTSDTGESFLIDTLGRAISIPSAGQAALLGLVSPKSVTLSKLTGYSRTATFNRVKIKCGTQTYLAITGVLYPIADDLAAEYPGSIATLSIQGCSSLQKSSQPVGNYITTSDPTAIWLVIDGKRSKITKNQYLTRKLGTPGMVKVGPYFASKIAIASTVSATPAPTNTHVVASGETFSSIATKYGLTVTRLKALNPTVTNINSIRVGQVLIIR